MASKSNKVIYAALTGNLLIAITKFIAAIFTRSSAMLTEGIHSTVDTGNQLLMLLGMKKSEQPANVRYPYGYGKEIYFWSFVVAILIFALGAGISIYEGIQSLKDPHTMESVTVNYIVLALAVCFEGYSWNVARSEFKQTMGDRGYIEAVNDAKDPTTFVVLFEDSAALLGLFVAFLGIILTEYTGILIFDGIASILIGVILGITAIGLAYETKGLLIGESADPKIVDGISEIAKDHPEIIQVNETLTMHMGPDYILVNLSVDFDDSLSADKIEKAIAHLTGDIKKRYSRVKRVFIEAEEPA